MTYTTKTPRLFAKYFCEQDSRKLAKDLELFEKCHGEAASVEVIFFIENGLINRMATPSDLPMVMFWDITSPTMPLINTTQSASCL